MPYHIAKSARCEKSQPWAVIDTASGKIMGCHASRDDALKQQAALYANEPSIKSYDPLMITRNPERAHDANTEALPVTRNPGRDESPAVTYASRHLHACGHSCLGTACGEHELCLMCRAKEENRTKLNKSEVSYGPGRGSTTCQNCVHFISPGRCELVAGAVTPDAWCNRFKRGASREMVRRVEDWRFTGPDWRPA